MAEFVDASILDLVRATQFIHHIRPSLQDKLVCAIEKAKPMDQSVVFHLMKRKVEEGEKRSTDDIEYFILSSEYILEHSYWKEQNDEST